MSQSPAPIPMPSHVPPTVQGRVPVNTIWPKVIGITSIVLGGLGVFTNCLGVVSTVFMSYFQKFTPTPTGATATTTINGVTTSTTANPMEAMQSAMGKWQPWIGAAAVLQLLAAALLLIAGIALQRRVRAGVTLHYGYAAFRTCTVLFYNIFNYMYMKDMFAGMAAQTSSAGGGMSPALMSGMMSSFGMIGVIIGVVWGVAYPAFLVIWFNTTAVRRETSEWN